MASYLRLAWSPLWCGLLTLHYDGLIEYRHVLNDREYTFHYGLQAHFYFLFHVPALLMDRKSS